MTFAMIKPDAVESGHTGAILQIIIAAGFQVVALKMTRLDKTRAKGFYAVHQNRPFYRDLVEFISSGPIVVMILRKENAVQTFRELIGATDPREAEKGTIRSIYAKSVGENAIHGSDSDDNAVKEANFHFQEQEIFEY
jgi:nucleoside-diphosphate kinase